MALNDHSDATDFGDVGDANGGLLCTKNRGDATSHGAVHEIMDISTLVGVANVVESNPQHAPLFGVTGEQSLNRKTDID